jgi:MFS family permease
MPRHGFRIVRFCLPRIKAIASSPQRKGYVAVSRDGTKIAYNVLRVIQGTALGLEFGGATSLLAEVAAGRRARAFWISIANLGLALGLMAGSFTFFALRNTFADTGWRVAMLLSAIIVIPALFARYWLSDSPLFELLKSREERSKAPSFEVFREHAKPLILLAIVSAFQIMDSVVTGTYIVSFMRLAGIPLATTAVIIFLSRIADVLGVLVTGPLADVLRRRKLAYAAIGISTILSDCGKLPYQIPVLRIRHILQYGRRLWRHDRAPSPREADRVRRAS